MYTRNGLNRTSVQCGVSQERLTQEPVRETRHRLRVWASGARDGLVPFVWLAALPSRARTD